MIKLHARDRAQLVVFAYQSGLMAPPADGGAHEANAGRRLTRPRGGQAARAL